MSINPDQLAKKVLLKTLGQQRGPVTHPYSDKDAINIYNFGRVYQSSIWGNVMMIDVTGCNYRCPFCWVSDEALSGHKGTREFLQKKKAKLRGILKNKDTVTSRDLWHEIDRKFPNTTNKDIPLFAFSGGEPTLYRGALRNFSQEAKNRGSQVAIYTHAQHITDCEDYLEVFDGLQDTVMFSVSIKGATPENFEIATGVDSQHWHKGYQALAEIYQKGFYAVPYTPMLNVIGYGKAEENVKALHRDFSAIHPELPRLIVYDAVSRGNVVHDPIRQADKMRHAGLTGISPGRTEKIMLNYFADNGTPVIPRSTLEPRISGEGGLLIDKIRNELRIT